jgi:hypothetical protein
MHDLVGTRFTASHSFGMVWDEVEFVPTKSLPRRIHIGRLMIELHCTIVDYGTI